MLLAKKSSFIKFRQGGGGHVPLATGSYVSDKKR